MSAQSIDAIVLDCRHAAPLARFWAEALGWSVRPYDDEEIARKITIKTGLAHAEWAGAAGKPCKINLLDTPGYSTFINETKASLGAADAGVILVDAVAGVQVVTEKVWDYCTEYDIPRAFVINWMDRELASFERAMESVKEVFGRAVVPIQLPIGAEKNFRGAVDLIGMKAHLYDLDGNGKAKVEEIPADMAEAAKAAIASPLLELSIDGAKGILFLVTGGRDLGMYELSEAAKIITEHADPNAKIIYGTVIDENMKDEVRVTVIATGFGDNKKMAEPATKFGHNRYNVPVSSSLRSVGDLKAPVIKPAIKKEIIITQPPMKQEAAEEAAAAGDDDLEIPAFIRKKMM